MQLKPLPAESRVYVDQQPVTVRQGRVALPAGWHAVQVERRRNGQVLAFRRPVQIVGNKTVEMRIVWHLVVLGTIADHLERYEVPGPPGPVGEVGPAAPVYHPLPAQIDEVTLRPLLQETRESLLSDMEARVQADLNDLTAVSVSRFFYDPPGRQKVFPMYLYDPTGTIARFPGPSGPVGEKGASGLRAEVRLLRTQRGAAIEEALNRQLGLSQIAQVLSVVEGRRKSLRSGAGTAPDKTFRVLTSEWRASLDAERRRALAAPPIPMEVFSPEGPAGATGRRGPDGIPPAGAMQVVLPNTVVDSLLAELAGDKMTQVRVGALREAIQEFEQRVYLTEGISLEQHLPHGGAQTQAHKAPADPAPASGVDIRYIPGKKPCVAITWSWRDLSGRWNWHRHTAKGNVRVRLFAVKESKTPAGHDMEIIHPYWDMPVEIDTPRGLPVRVKVGDGPGYLSPYSLQVNGRATRLQESGLWLRGGHNLLLVTYPDPE